jgi:hypothetical protein
MAGSLQFVDTIGSIDSKLIIDRTAEVDLFPFFRDLFENIDWMRYNDLDKTAKAELSHMGEFFEKFEKARWNVRKKEAELSFVMDDFFRAFLAFYQIEQTTSFLEDNFSDANDFYNAALLDRLNNFNKTHARILFLRDGLEESSNFLIKPRDGCSVEIIESIMSYKSTKKNGFFMHHNRKFPMVRNTTYLYSSDKIESIEQQLYYKSRDAKSRDAPGIKTLLRVPAIKYKPNLEGLNTSDIKLYYSDPTNI